MNFYRKQGRKDLVEQKSTKDRRKSCSCTERDRKRREGKSGHRENGEEEEQTVRTTRLRRQQIIRGQDED